MWRTLVTIFYKDGNKCTEERAALCSNTEERFSGVMRKHRSAVMMAGGSRHKLRVELMCNHKSTLKVQSAEFKMYYLYWNCSTINCTLYVILDLCRSRSLFPESSWWCWKLYWLYTRPFMSHSSHIVKVCLWSENEWTNHSITNAEPSICCSQ